MNASLGPDTNAVTFDFADPGTQTSLGTVTWDPSLGTPFTGQVGDTQLAIAWADALPSARPRSPSRSRRPLPLSEAQQKVLLLDGNYPGITSGSYVVIDSAGPTGSTSGVQYPVITQVDLGGHGRGERLRDHGEGHPADPDRTSGSTRAPCSSPRCGR